ncbi:unnamed protein product, partial [Choristocarpus tenellus]
GRELWLSLLCFLFTESFVHIFLFSKDKRGLLGSDQLQQRVGLWFSSAHLLLIPVRWKFVVNIEQKRRAYSAQFDWTPAPGPVTHHSHNIDSTCRGRIYLYPQRTHYGKSPEPVNLRKAL